MPLLTRPTITPPPSTDTGARGLPELRHALNDDAPALRRMAAREIATFEGASALLVLRLNSERDDSVREVILSSLIRIADDAAVVGLSQCLRSADAAVRNGAVEAMQCLPDAVAPLMDSLLRDPDADVRMFAITVLQEMEHENIEQWLLEVLEHDEHVNVCAAALEVLREVATPAAIEVMLRAKSRFADEPFIAFAVDVALRRVRGD